jgi:integrase/recombinase XerD
MPVVDPCLIRSSDRFGGPVVRVGVPLAEEYLEFLAGRCRPNTVLAAGYDLRVFFAVVGKAPDEVRPGDVLGFITAQRTGRAGEQPLQSVDLDGEPGGVSSSTVREPYGCSLSASTSGAGTRPRPGCRCSLVTCPARTILIQSVNH